MFVLTRAPKQNQYSCRCWTPPVGRKVLRSTDLETNEPPLSMLRRKSLAHASQLTKSDELVRGRCKRSSLSQVFLSQVRFSLRGHDKKISHRAFPAFSRLFLFLGTRLARSEPQALVASRRIKATNQSVTKANLKN